MLKVNCRTKKGIFYIHVYCSILYIVHSSCSSFTCTSIYFIYTFHEEGTRLCSTPSRTVNMSSHCPPYLYYRCTRSTLISEIHFTAWSCVVAGYTHTCTHLSTFNGNTLICAASNATVDTPASNSQPFCNVNRVVFFSLIFYTANKGWVSQLVKTLSPLPLPPTPPLLPPAFDHSPAWLVQCPWLAPFLHRWHSTQQHY